MANTQRRRMLRAALWLNLALLVVVFLLGMDVNLYLAFPANLPAPLAMRSPAVQAHMVVASLVALVSVAAAILSLLERRAAVSVATLAGVALTALAYGAGLSFLNNGYQEGASLVMAIGFIGAFVAYGLAAYVARPQLPQLAAAQTQLGAQRR